MVERFPPGTAGVVVIAPVINIPHVRGDLGLLLVQPANTVVGARIVGIVRIMLGVSRCREDGAKSHDDKKLFQGHAPGSRAPQRYEADSFDEGSSSHPRCGAPPYS
jgi:hypothetical protein